MYRCTSVLFVSHQSLTNDFHSHTIRILHVSSRKMASYSYRVLHPVCWTRRRLGYCSHGQVLGSGVTPLSILRGRKRNSVRMQDVCNYSVRGAAAAFVVQYIVQDVLWVTGLLLRQWKAASSWASERNVNAVMCVSTVQPVMSRLHFFV